MCYYCNAFVTSKFYLKVVSRWTRIPLTTLDQEAKDKLIHLAEKLHERVVGQNEAVKLVAQAFLRSRAGFGQSGQPISAFLFLGPLGVGKTVLAKALAEKIFDNEKALIRFDMSEYTESGSVSRLIGGPQRFVFLNFVHTSCFSTHKHISQIYLIF